MGSTGYCVNMHVLKDIGMGGSLSTNHLMAVVSRYQLAFFMIKVSVTVEYSTVIVK